MNADELLDAFSDLDERTVRSAAALLGYEEERITMKRKHKKILVRTLLIAAILTILSIGTAYAMGLFSMDVRAPEEGEELVGWSISYDPRTSEEIREETDLTKSPLILQFTGEGEIHQVRFRPGWLPEAEESDFLERYGDPGVEDWSYYYTCFFDRSQGGAGVSYQLECHYTFPGYTCYMSGESARVVKEEEWDGLQIVEIEQQTFFRDKTGSPVTQRYVLVFNSDEGWYVSVAGGASFETLEHIARELEFRSIDALAEPYTGGNYYHLGVGVG